MLVASDTSPRIPVPASLLREPPPGKSPPSWSRRKRDFVHRMRAIGALRRAGFAVDPRLQDDEGRDLPERDAATVSALAEDVIRELADGRSAHAKRTIANLEASRKADPEQVDELLNTVYRAHTCGERSRDVLDSFLDTFERWLTPAGIAKVDLLFDRVTLDRAPESLGILLLSTTRLTRGSFARRDAFVERYRAWLVGRSGRTSEDVDALLAGLRE
jgi:hypothetical protein